MKNTLKGYLIGVLSTIMLLGCVTYATSTTKTIDVIYDNIKVYKDNVLCETKDANGTVVEPFIYNGTTYMPVRGTANLAGMDVTWDGATKSVYLWDKITANNTYLVDVKPPYDSSSMGVYQLSTGRTFTMAGEKYSNGIASSGGGDARALFNLDSKYETLECIVGHSWNNGRAKTATFVIDDKVVKTVDLKPECMPKAISVPLNFGLQMKIIVTGGEIGFANMIVK